MNILYLSSVRIPSEQASGLAIVRQCQAFVDNGNSLDLLIPVRLSSIQSSIEKVYGITPNFSVVEIKSFFLYSLGKVGFYFMLLIESLKMLWYYFKRGGQFDIVYSRDQRLLFPFVLFGLSKKCFLELHTKQSDFITKLVAKRAKKLIVISEGLKEYYAHLTKRDSILMLPSGVDLEQFKDLPEQSVLKRKFGLPHDKIVYAYIGKYKTMGESKGVEEIIQAFALARKELKNIHLLIVGLEESEKKEVLGIMEECSLSRDSYSLMPLDQRIFAEYLMASDVLLMNYPNTEHYAKYMSPTKLFAYLASGKPIISSDLPSLRLIVTNKEVVFVSTDEVSVFVKEIVDMAKYIDVAESLSSERTRSVSRYNWQARAERILTF